MEVFETPFKEVKLFRTKYFEDERGYFTQTYNFDEYWENLGIGSKFYQDNQSYTKERFTLRGLHFQNQPHGVMKIVRCIKGSAIDVVVDIRKGSPSYKKWYSAKISEDNRISIICPVGFAHGIITLTEDTILNYKMDKVYNKESDRSIAWNDPTIGINWVTNFPILSDKDRNAPLLDDSDANFVYGVNS